ncbi:MAG: hypothetical protein JW787_08365 [Sedimentisphaerales bacterium]|nr:hypothetical protein [Sedimentisphaerales bacterium]
MGRYGKICIVFLWILNIIFVNMGYVGIAKIERQHFPPFNEGYGMMHIFYSFHVVPDRVILFWHSAIGHAVIWAGCIILPIIAYILFSREKFLAGLSTLLLSIIPFGIVGFLIWLHAFIDLPHDW